MLRVGVMASGRGSNFQAIAEACRQDDFPAEIAVLFYDRPEAQAAERAENFDVPVHYLDYEKTSGKKVPERELIEKAWKLDVELLALAGFMRRLSSRVVDEFADRIMNVHPSLLPAFKGLDAPGQALKYGVKVTGCTVHFVTTELDAGPIILQKPVAVKEGETTDELAARIRSEEHVIYPRALRLYAEDRLKIHDGRVEIRQ
ncbi:phosphoribosylglycinamide formyltransferase [Halarsenatibacter silvermanii]|uniref:Phosphoribosylglycinamide formyltransferase n=1 Tax=Halarsenatibacter silvermanii TaxID=321763 RepID=A0A1G9PVY8_9FIRM|nr:phosphoribosylglycinamide formyltransferase [Halarsenatibacter silvermanii]SDM02275.1 phosphoribosylglycinamide formyltransferase-1 [Halarsenatibacter silvermanii]